MTLPAELESAARSSAAPELVRVNFERLLESDASSAERLGSDGRLAGVVAAVMAGSRSLSSLVLTDRAALEVIASCLPKRPEATVTASMSRPSIADPRLAGDAADLVRRKRLDDTTRR